MLRTGYEDSVSALASMTTDTPVVATDSSEWTRAWAAIGLRPTAPAVAFDREFALLYGYPRGSCLANQSGVDSVRAANGGVVVVYTWEDDRGACADTSSYSVLAVAIERPSRSAKLPKVVLRDHMRSLEPWR